MKNVLSFHWLRMAMIALTVSIIATGCGNDAGTPDATPDTPEKPAVEEKAEAPAEVKEAMPAEAPAEVAPAVEEAPAEEAASVASAAAALTGTVKLIGTPPEMTVQVTTSDPKCHAMHGDDPLKSDRVLCGPNGGLQNVYLSVTNPPEGDYPTPEEPIILDQVGCMYVPHVVGIQTDQTLEVRNSDPTMHNVHRVAKLNGSENKIQMANAKPFLHTFTKEEDRMRYKCDIHPWMMSFVFVKDHPFFAVTDENGQFSIAGLPAGDYDIKAWHEHYRELDGKVTIDANGAGTLDLTYTAEEE